VVRQWPRRFDRLIAGGIAVGLAFVVCSLAHTQGLRVPDSRLPRLPDGRPDLTAPAPKTADGKPDLSGIWHSADGKYSSNLAADGVDAPFQLWAAALFKERQRSEGKDRPSSRCLPRGLPGAMVARDYPWKIVQTPGAILILFDESLHYRQILTDGRGFPEDPTPTWLGYSIGKWEGDTLVADTTGFNDKTWVDRAGHPHSEDLHVVERIRRADPKTLQIDITIEDPKAYTKPFTVRVNHQLMPDTELMEFVCEERDAVHYIGKDTKR
jgi:hypothetical protein